MSAPDYDSELDAIIYMALNDSEATLDPWCQLCGCDGNNACIDGRGVPCHWYRTKPYVCSCCASMIGLSMLASQRDRGGVDWPTFHPCTQLAPCSP